MSGFYRREGAGARQVLVYLHGHGGAPALVHPSLRRHHDDGWVRVCPRGPVPTEGGWSWFDSGPRGVDATSLAASVDAIVAVVEATLAELEGSWSDVVLGGFSQGGAAALAAAARVGTGGTRIGGLLLQSAFVPESLDLEVDPSTVSCRSALVQHGRDDDVVPAFMGEDLAAGLATGSVDDVRFDLLDGGHTLTTTMLDGALAWLRG